MKGTLWAAYNGIIEMLDHESTYKNRYHRLESVWFGDAQQTKQADTTSQWACWHADISGFK